MSGESDIGELPFRDWRRPWHLCEVRGLCDSHRTVSPASRSIDGYSASLMNDVTQILVTGGAARPVPPGRRAPWPPGRVPARQARRGSKPRFSAT